MKNVTLKRSCECFRPLFFYKDELHGEQIEQIKIFDGVNVYTVNRGWLENENDRGRDIKEMYFEELTKKRKINLTLKESFLAKAENWQKRHVLTLFLYIPDIKTEVFLWNENLNGKHFYKKLNFVFNGVEICQHIFDHFEESDLKKQAEELSEELEKDLYIKIDSYQLTRILNKYNIVKK